MDWVTMLPTHYDPYVEQCYTIPTHQESECVPYADIFHICSKLINADILYVTGCLAGIDKDSQVLPKAESFKMYP